jgi:hypothetical protein
MIDQPPVRGGFNGTLRSQMSPTLQRRLAEEEDREAREAKREERERAQRAEAFQADSIQGAIALALASGEAFHPRWLRGEKLGHTTSEFIAQRSAQMDIEDAQREARRQAAIRKVLAQLDESNSGDFTADEVLAERSERDKQETRQREARMSASVRRHVQGQTVAEARRAALGDTTRAIYAVERMRGSR